MKGWRKKRGRSGKPNYRTSGRSSCLSKRLTSSRLFNSSQRLLFLGEPKAKRRREKRRSDEKLL
jgi:hypothetical protein